MTITQAVLSPLMSSLDSSNMYTLCTCKDNYIWGSKSPEESEIVALESEVEQLKGNLQLAGKNMKKYGSTTSSGTPMLLTKRKGRSSKRIWISLPSR